MFHRMTEPKKVFSICIRLLALGIVMLWGLSMCSAAPPSSLQNKKVLLLHSYHKGYQWTDDISKGIEDILGKKVSLHIDYLDTKRQNAPEYIDMVLEMLDFKHKKNRFDLVICSDNNAFNLMKKNGLRIFGNTPVVFCGVNNLKPIELEGLDNYTGVSEKADFLSCIRLIKTIHPGKNTLVCIADYTTTGRRSVQQLLDMKPKLDALFSRTNLFYDITMSDLQAELSALDKKDCVVFYIPFFMDKDGRFFEYDESARLISSASPVPVYGTWDFSLGHGIVGGYLVSGYDQGLTAARQALEILSGKPVSKVPVVWESPNRYKFDYRQLERFHINPIDLPPGSRIINKPVSFYEHYRGIIWGVGFLLIFLIVLVSFLIFNIIHRFRIEKELVKSEKFSSNLLNSSPYPIVVIDPDKAVRYVSPAFETLTGFPSKEVVGLKPPYPWWPEELTDTIISRYNASLLNGCAGVEECFEKKNNERFWVNITLIPVKEGTQLKYYLTNWVETTRQIHDRNELKKAKAYIDNIVNSMPSALIGVDTDGNITQWNSRAEDETGIRKKDAVGKPLGTILPRFGRTEMQHIQKTIRDRMVQDNIERKYETNGTIRYEDITIYPLVANGVDGAVIRIDDKTEQKRLEELLIQSEKMLSVGNLAAGMAHEINNPLAGIMQNVQVIKRRLTTNIPANDRDALAAGTTMDAIKRFMETRGIIEQLEHVRKAGSRAAKLVKSMLTFSRGSSGGKLPHDPAELLDSAIELAGNDYNLKKKYDFRQIRIIREYDPDTPLVVCESSKIQQVFLNLLSNGAQAMMEKWTGDPEEFSPVFTLKIYPTDRHIIFEIQDNGPGIKPDIQKHIFEPFFTTKPVGVGTGLGLSISYFIVQQDHSGELSVQSEPGKGTTFIIKLPI